MRRIATPLLLFLLPLSFFLAFFHWEILQVGNAGWLLRGTDNGENALGAHAYWYDPQAGASLTTKLLNAPEGVPILYTDSNPLITLLAKPVAALLPPDAQLVGPFILINLVLQAIFAWLLLRRHAPGPLALWAGVALLAFPPTLANRFVHANLMAHWTILAALFLFLDARRGEQLRWWGPLIAVSAFIHSYLLIMVGAIWASAMLVRLVKGPNKARLIVVGQSLAVLALVAILALWLGVGATRSTGSFGRFAMPLDALWNPEIGNFSTLLPIHRDNGGVWFEGFQYLGAGGLVLIATALVVGWSKPAPEKERADSRRLLGLAPALIVLTVLATLHTSLPTTIMDLLDPVRASGRLFWPVGYVLVFVAILVVFRLPAERAGLALIGMIALQVVDLTNMAATIRAQTEEAERHRLYALTLDPRWDQLIRQSRSISFMSGDIALDLNLFQEIAWRAAKIGRPVGNVYAARARTVTIHRLEAETAAFARGELVPGRLYIVLAGSKLPRAAAIAGGPHVLKLDGRSVIAPF